MITGSLDTVTGMGVGRGTEKGGSPNPPTYICMRALRIVQVCMKLFKNLITNFIFAGGGGGGGG